MEKEVQSETYFPDFSDICDESFQFWDFMTHKETLKERPIDNETTFENVRSHSDHSSLRDDDSHTFWDFLSSRTENTQHSPDSRQFSDIFSDKVEKNLKPTYGSRETNDDVKARQKHTASDEFWDFLNSSIEDNKNCAAEVHLIPCGTPVTKEQLNTSSFLETSAAILPRISSVYSLNTTRSVEALSEIITPLTSVMNNSCEFTEATHQLVVHNNAPSDHDMVYAQSTDGGNFSQIPLKHNTNATHQVEAYENPMNDYEIKYYLTQNTDRGNSLNSSSHSILNHSTETINQTVAQENSMSHYKLESYADTLKLQDPISRKSLILRESPAKLSTCTSCSTLSSVSCKIQHLKLKDENISRPENMGVNNGMEPLYVSLPKSEMLQKPNYSQFLIIVNNAQPQIALKENEAVKKIEQNITAQNFSSTENHSFADDNLQSDFRLAGFRNNHVLNVCKRKRSFDSPFATPNGSESNCPIPVSSTPLDTDTLNSISARFKSKQNNFSKIVKKQNLNQKPIKCIPLGRCKNAIQQTNTPISLEAYEANAENTLLKPCSTPLLRGDGESVRNADKTPPSLSKSQSNSFLTVTFPQIPNSNAKYVINYPRQSIIQNARQSIAPIIPNARQSIAPIIPNARQSIAPIIPNAKQNIAPIIPNAKLSIAPIVPNVRLSIAPIIPNARQSIAPIVPNAKQNIAPSSCQVTEIQYTLSSGIFQEPTSSSLSSKYKVVPKTKKCRRKTVKELLEERQSEIASLSKQRKVSKHCVGEASSEIGNKIHSKTDCYDDPKNDDTATHHGGEMSHQWPHEKSLRPRHYDMSELQIGFFKVQEDVDARGRFRSKFKVLFMKRQFLYDFPVSRCNQPSLKKLEQKWDDEMARIAIPFRTITSIHLKDRMIHLNVDSTPHFSLMNSQLSQLADNTTSWSHFLQTSSTHKVVLRKRQASKLKLVLCQFDERFITLTDIIVTSCENQFESPVKKRFSKNRKFVARRPPEDSQNLILSQMCSCRTSCRSIRCSCVKAARSCSSTCQCSNCNNPLNVLETIGLDIYISLNDNCLFQNIYQIPDLSNYLAREVRLDCCNCLARIQDCIPGTVLCPNTNCNAALQYSWCQKMVSYPESNPRNHCSLCAQCRFSNGRHCYVCKKCYAVTSKSNKCPTCLRENSTLRQLPRRSLNTFCSDKTLTSTSSQPQIVVLNASSSVLTKPPEEINKMNS
nr:uncharacterized protein LOC107454613 isoform X2 [Parasteatoda tepidariorum]